MFLDHLFVYVCLSLCTTGWQQMLEYKKKQLGQRQNKSITVDLCVLLLLETKGLVPESKFPNAHAKIHVLRHIKTVMHESTP